jgi:hypothetical protein
MVSRSVPVPDSINHLKLHDMAGKRISSLFYYKHLSPSPISIFVATIIV